MWSIRQMISSFTDERQRMRDCSEEFMVNYLRCLE
jgi:hypothetical protein